MMACAVPIVEVRVPEPEPGEWVRAPEDFYVVAHVADRVEAAVVRVTYVDGPAPVKRRVYYLGRLLREDEVEPGGDIGARGWRLPPVCARLDYPDVRFWGLELMFPARGYYRLAIETRFTRTGEGEARVCDRREVTVPVGAPAEAWKQGIAAVVASIASLTWLLMPRKRT